MIKRRERSAGYSRAARPVGLHTNLDTGPSPGQTAPIMNVSAFDRMGRYVVLLACLAVTPEEGKAEGAAEWSWQEPHARVLPTGDLEWTPRAFEFQAAGPVRYIDFAAGDDANDGLTKSTAWKHHPWDPQAVGQAKACQGSHTYVFKQGVEYRGELNAHESGTADAPIILTRDPSWGAGPAVICGSEAVTGWKSGADDSLIPEPEKVWHVDLNWAPRAVWTVGQGGAVTRVALARTPNWTISDLDDIKSEWWTWKNPDKPFDNYATINGQRRHLAFDQADINESKPQEYYEGAIVWTTKGWVMGNPFPARVLAVDREKGSLVFPGQWGGVPSYKVIRGCQFYLEDKPQYLDSPGEFWFDKKGNGGRLYLRLPGDQDPNTVRVEVAKRIHFVDSRGVSNLRVRGLTFRFSNVYWNLTAAPYWVSHESIDVQPGCVRLLGSGTNLEVSHCVFEHIHKGVRLKAMGREDAIDRVLVADNVFSDADSGGVELGDSTTYGDVAEPMGRLYDVRVLRNRFDHIGLRPDLFGQGVAVLVDYAETAEVAGNLFDRICAQGVDVHGAKASGAATDRPFARLLIHHNKAVDTLINVDDFGGIETWQGGPAYVYDNISGNPGGYRSWDHTLNPNSESRFGHAYYLDGGFKNYYFNNIAWGKSKGPAGKLANTSAFQEIISYQNTFFNNTIYNFVRGSRRQAPEAGRVKFLSNVWQSMGERVFRDADPAKTSAAGNEADAGPRRDRYAIDTDAYGRNVFYDVGDSFAVFEPSGRWLKTLPAFQQALAKYQPLASDVGIMAGQPPLRDAAAHDFRPSANSAARGLGAKVFVPWSLYETVGEWNFCPLPGDATRILDEHWCMSPYYTGRDDYYKFPTYPLKGINISLKDYQGGPLENWTTGALGFNGRDQYAVLKNEDICRPVEYGVSFQPADWVTVTYPKAMAVGQSCEVDLQLHHVKDGLKLHCDLNWAKKNESFGGVNTWGGPPKDVRGPGPYQFAFVPQEKADLGSFVLTIYLSTTGDWKDKTLLATVGVPVGAAEGQTRRASLAGDKIVEQRKVTGPDLSSPQIHTSSFLIEAYFKTAPGQKDGVLIQKITTSPPRVVPVERDGRTNAVVVQKTDGAGFVLAVNQAGGVTLGATAGGDIASLASHGIVNDGQWHHVVAEAERESSTFTLYLDGQRDAWGRGLGPNASLANDADLYVGGTPAGHCLNGAIDFLRLARGTLADSKTTIAELYAWEFHGPFLQDFTGRERPAGGGEAGAIDGAPAREK